MQADQAEVGEDLKVGGPGTITTPRETTWVHSIHWVPFRASLKVAIELSLASASDPRPFHQAAGIAEWLPFAWETVMQTYHLNATSTLISFPKQK